jgi:serine/threonine protein kinase
LLLLLLPLPALLLPPAGQTGSYLSMAPEVFLGQPYNEKVDVFSFGVLLYELLSRCLLMFSELPARNSDPTITERWVGGCGWGGHRGGVLQDARLVSLPQWPSLLPLQLLLLLLAAAFF